jgi:hypothetical protein
MATTMTNNTNYSGKSAGEYIKAAFLANETLQHITVKENIDYRQVVKNLINEITFGAQNCAWTPTGEVTLNERWLTLKKFQVQQEICVNKFLNDYPALDAQQGRLDPAFTEALIANMLEGIAQENERQVWVGDATANPTTEYDGLLTLIGQDVDNDVNFVASPVPIDTTNVIAKIQALIAECPNGVKFGNEKPTIYMDPSVWEAFMYASAAAGNGWYTYGGLEVPKTFMGTYPIAVCPGMPSGESTMVMAPKSNLWFGTNVLNNWNDVTVVDMTTFAEDNVRFSAKFFAAAQYGIGAKIAAYSTWF